MRISIPILYSFFMLLMAVLVPGKNMAQIEYIGYLGKPNIKPGAAITVFDPNTNNSTTHSWVDRKPFIKLLYSRKSLTDVSGNIDWSYEVRVKFMNTGDTTKFFTDTLVISKNDSTPSYSSLKTYNDINWTGVRLRVITVCAKMGTSSTCITNPETYPLLPADIELQAGMTRKSLSGFTSWYSVPTINNDYENPDSDCSGGYIEDVDSLKMAYSGLRTTGRDAVLTNYGFTISNIGQIYSDWMYIIDEKGEIISKALDNWESSLLTPYGHTVVATDTKDLVEEFFQTRYIYSMGKLSIEGAAQGSVEGAKNVRLEFLKKLSAEFMLKYREKAILQLAQTKPALAPLFSKVFMERATEVAGSLIKTFNEQITEEENVFVSASTNSYDWARLNVDLIENISSLDDQYNTSLRKINEYWELRCHSMSVELPQTCEERYLYDLSLLQIQHDTIIDSIKQKINVTHGNIFENKQRYLTYLLPHTQTFREALELVNENLFDMSGISPENKDAVMEQLSETDAQQVESVAFLYEALIIQFAKEYIPPSNPRYWQLDELYNTLENEIYTAVTAITFPKKIEVLEQNGGPSAPDVDAHITDYVNALQDYLEGANTSIDSAGAQDSTSRITWLMQTARFHFLSGQENALFESRKYDLYMSYEGSCALNWPAPKEDLIFSEMLEHADNHAKNLVLYDNQIYDDMADIYTDLGLFPSVEENWTGFEKTVNINEFPAFISYADSVYLSLFAICAGNSFDLIFDSLANSPGVHIDSLGARLVNDLDDNEGHFANYYSAGYDPGSALDQAYWNAQTDAAKRLIAERYKFILDGFRAFVESQNDSDLTSCVDSLFLSFVQTDSLLAAQYKSIVHDAGEDKATGLGYNIGDLVGFVYRIGPGMYNLLHEKAVAAAYLTEDPAIAKQRNRALTKPYGYNSISETVPLTTAIDGDWNKFVKADQAGRDKIESLFHALTSSYANDDINHYVMYPKSDEYIDWLVDSTINREIDTLECLPNEIKSQIWALFTANTGLAMDQASSEFSDVYVPMLQDAVMWLSENDVEINGEALAMKTETEKIFLSRLLELKIGLWNNALYEVLFTNGELSLLECATLEPTKSHIDNIFEYRDAIITRFVSQGAGGVTTQQAEDLFDALELQSRVSSSQRFMNRSLNSYMPYEKAVDQIQKAAATTLFPSPIPIPQVGEMESWMNLQPTGELIALTGPIYEPAPPMQLTTETGACGSQRFITWTSVTNAVEYDLEWVYIDNEIRDANGNSLNSLTSTTYNAFQLAEPVRVTTKLTKFPIPEEYPNGKLYFRVRAVARITDNVNQDYTQPQYFPWSDYVSGYPVLIVTVNFNDKNPYLTAKKNNLNWQWECTYAEDAKFKRVMAYYDGHNRSRQMLTHLSTDGLTAIGETLYDHEGRAAVQMLPYPEKCSELSYRKDIRRNFSTTATFGKDDFEPTAGNKQVSTFRGSSNYYSSQNPFMAGDNPLSNLDAIPDAGNYPYTRNVFMNDNTGRLLASSGVGPTHAIGSGHETKYLYGNATSTELHRLFGRNVGIASHYKKNAVVDANGQLSVSYVDQENRSIATALAGTPPSNLLAIPSYQPETLTVNMTDNTIYNEEDGTAIISFNHVNEIVNNPYTFTYDYGRDMVTDPSFTGCIFCEFDLEIWVADMDGNLLPLTNIVGATSTNNRILKHLGASPPGQLEACIDPGQSMPNQITFKATLPAIGTYRIFKKITWDKAKALQALKTALNRPQNTISQGAYNTFYQESINNIHPEDCNQYEYNNDFNQIPFNDLRAAANAECEAMLTKMTMQIRRNELPAGAPNPNFIGKYNLSNGFWMTVKMLRSNYSSDPFTHINPSVIDISIPLEQIIQSYPWPEEWERELVKAHPEYCWYKKCRDNSALNSKAYDIRMAQNTGLSQARSAGFMNPQSMSPMPSGTPSLMTNTGTNQPDLQNTWVRDKMVNLPDDIGGSIWKRGYAPYDGYFYESPPELTKDKAAWQIFRGQYLDLKQDFFYQEAGTCKYIYDETDTTPQDQPAYAYAVVKKPIHPTTTEEMQTAQNSAANTSGAGSTMCSNMCEQNANTWLMQLLGPCIGDFDKLSPSLQNTYNDLKIRFIQYCMADCGQPLPNANPNGIIRQSDIENAQYASGSSLGIIIGIYQNTFGLLPGCNPIVTTVGSTWQSPLSVPNDFYANDKVCEEVPCFFNSNKDLTEFVKAYNTARYEMTTGPCEHSLNPTFKYVSSSGCESTVIIPYVEIDETALEQCRTAYCNPNGQNCQSPQFITCAGNAPIREADQQVRIMCRQTPITMEFQTEQGVIIHPSKITGALPYQLVTTNVPQGTVIYKAYLNYNPPVITCANPITGVASKKNGPVAQSIPGKIVFKNLHLQCTFPSCAYTIKPNDPVVYEEPCLAQLQNMAEENANALYEQWLEEQLSNAWERITCRLPENFRMQYLKSEHHYTLYYYDQAGNLTLTVPPEGVKPLTATSFNTNGSWKGNYATTNWAYEPQHGMDSRYKFNSLQVAVESETPDGDFSRFSPDDLGRPAISVNRKQKERSVSESTPSSIIKYESYTTYDALGRVVEVGEQKRTFNNLGTQLSQVRSQITRTEYDKQYTQPAQSFYGENTRSRVSRITYQETSGTAYQHAYYYSYDIHGNVKTMLTEVPALATFGRRFFRTDYYYDLISGKVNEVHYQRNLPDQFYYRYQYDADNRLTIAESSRDYYYWDKDAKYFYYPHGPLMRVETGEEKVQGSDYAYTIHGWLKSVNAGALNPEYDPGADGRETLAGNPHTMVARDAYGYVLDYYEGDYTPAGGSAVKNRPEVPAGSPFRTYTLQNGLYNGNIVRMVTALSTPNEAIMPVLGNGYIYDQLNRIRKHRTFEKSNMHASGQYTFSGVSEGTKWASEYTYDANGNILTLKRYNPAGTSLMDDLTYNYNTKAAPGVMIAGLEYNYGGKLNRLGNINDLTSSITYPGDIDSQSPNNYEYDAIGNLTKDVKEEIANIEWTVYGKIKKVTRTTGSKKPDLEFWYDAMGQRFMKCEKPKNQTNGALLSQQLWKFTYYQRDAQGNVLSIYQIAKKPADCPYEMKLDEQVLYGSNRLGVYRRKVNIGISGISLSLIPGIRTAFCVAIAEPVGTAVIEPTGFDPTLPAAVATHLGGLTETLYTQQIHAVATVSKTLPGGAVVTTVPTFWERSRRQYEFSNHLGNVLLTVSDLKKGMETGTPNSSVDYYTADVLTTHDYEPFGNQMPGRTLLEQACSTYISSDSIFVMKEPFDALDNNIWALDGATHTMAPGIITVNATAVNQGLSGLLTGVQPSKTYTIKVRLDQIPTNGVNISIRDYTTGALVLVWNTNITTTGTHTFTFTTNSAANTNVRVKIQTRNSGNSTFKVNDIRVYSMENVNHTDCTPQCSTYSAVNTITRAYEDFSTITPAELAALPWGSAGTTFGTVTETGGNIAGRMSGSVLNASVWRFLATTNDTVHTLRIRVKSSHGARVTVHRRPVGSTTVTAITTTTVGASSSYSNVTLNFTPVAGWEYIMTVYSTGPNGTAATVHMDDLHVTYLRPVTETVCGGHRDAYRFGFNGQMKDNEVYGEGNSYTAEHWQYDPRTGRRWNIDPVVKEWESPYAAFNNNPVLKSDPNGDDPGGPGGPGGPKTSQASSGSSAVDEISSTVKSIANTVTNFLFGDLLELNDLTTERSNIVKDGALNGGIRYQNAANNGGDLNQVGVDYQKDMEVNRIKVTAKALQLQQTALSSLVPAGQTASLGTSSIKIVVQTADNITEAVVKNGYTTVYRAVSKAELADVVKYGLRNKEGAYETGKLFAPTLEEAAKFGKNNFKFDGFSNTIIKVQIPNSIMNGATKFGADGMNAISIPANQLNSLKFNVLNYSPLIK